MGLPTLAGWGKRIREARERLGLTQDQLAQRIEADRKTVNRWEVEERRPAADELVRLAYVLGVSADHVLGLRVDPAGAYGRAIADRLRALADDLDQATPGESDPAGRAYRAAVEAKRTPGGPGPTRRRASEG